MSDRILARADYSPGHNEIWEAITIERSAAGAPGLIFVMTRWDNDELFERMSVSIPDGVALYRSCIDCGEPEGNS